MPNTYKKLESGEYGAWIQITDDFPPLPGDTVALLTKKGDTHFRTVKDVLEIRKTGYIVSLETTRKSEKSHNKKS